MFGISWAELFVILLVAVVILPARMWPDVARFLARAVKFVRGIIWKITDATEQIKSQVELEKPIDEIIHATTQDVLADFTTPIKKIKRSTQKKTSGRKKCKK